MLSLRSVDQPLWQNWLNIALIGFVARRAALGIGLHWPDLTTWSRASYLILLAVCVCAGGAIWLRARWVIAALLAVAAAFTLTTFTELALAMGDTQPRGWIISQWLAALAATVLLVRLAWRAGDHAQT
jgi:lysylphosphatidylglycerol synthetase-like protein (DUF2156 family)